MKLEKLHCMYWAEVVRTTNYILNRYSISSVEGKTPFEAWYDKKPTI